MIALLVNQSLYMHDYRQAVAFAEAALRTAGHQLTPALAADLHAMQAKAYAHLGDGRSALGAIRGAERAAERIRPKNEPAETGYVQPGLVNVQVAEALLRLGDLPAAREQAGLAARAPRTTGAGCTGLRCSRRSSSGRARRTGPSRRRSRWPSGPGGWSRSGCATGCASYASIWSRAVAPAPTKPPS